MSETRRDAAAACAKAQAEVRDGALNAEKDAGARHVVGPSCALEEGDILEYPVPEGLEEQAQRYLEDPGSFEVATPRLASTVMLLREAKPDDAGALEVFMLRRASTMAFVPDACVFPGGSADARDEACEVPLVGPSLEAWAQKLGCDVASAKHALIAAARELFEECGVLLASDASGNLVRDASDNDRHLADRQRLAAHEVSFGEYLIGRGLTLRGDLLHARAHWTTPPCEPRRYSTYFFTAELPQGQHADGLTSEATASGWVRPADIIARAEEGSARVMPPTIANLSDLTRAGSVEAACSEVRVNHVMLTPARDDAGSIVFRSVVR